MRGTAAYPGDGDEKPENVTGNSRSCRKSYTILMIVTHNFSDGVCEEATKNVGTPGGDGAMLLLGQLQATRRSQ
jgi:hypothetical protein